jgi:hypothetical protein
MISEERMLNSILIIPDSQDEVTSPGDAIGARTLLMKASRFLTELKRRKV